MPGLKLHIPTDLGQGRGMGSGCAPLAAAMGRELCGLNAWIAGNIMSGSSACCDSRAASVSPPGPCSGRGMHSAKNAEMVPTDSYTTESALMCRQVATAAPEMLYIQPKHI